jgi:hypothetical protein
MTEVLPPCKSGGPRAARFTPLPGGGVLAIDDRKRTRAYRVAEFAPDSGWSGRAFRLVKADGGDTYDVFVHHRGGHHTCSCAGATYRPQARCCHVEALLAVLLNGWMESDWADPEQDRGPAGAEDAPF